MTLLALELLRCEFTDQAPKGEAMARVTFATAFGHPLGPQQRLTSVFVPYRRAVPPILFDLAFVSDFASFGAAERQIYFSSAQRRSNGLSDICHGFWASIGSTTEADIKVRSIPSRHVLIFLRSGFG